VANGQWPYPQGMNVSGCRHIKKEVQNEKIRKGHQIEAPRKGPRDASNIN